MAGRHARPDPEMEQLRAGVNLADDAAPAGGAAEMPSSVFPFNRPVRVTLVADPECADLVAEGLDLLEIPYSRCGGSTFTLIRSGTDR